MSHSSYFHHLDTEHCYGATNITVASVWIGEGENVEILVKSVLCPNIRADQRRDVQHVLDAPKNVCGAPCKSVMISLDIRNLFFCKVKRLVSRQHWQEAAPTLMTAMSLLTRFASEV